MEKSIRKDYLLERWVVIAAKRALRPSDLARPPRAREPVMCPFCPGNEHLTPRAVLLYLPDREGGISKAKDTKTRRHRGWLIRCVQNLYPALSPLSKFFGRSSSFPYVAKPAKGYHEILIESPNHDEHLGVAGLGQVRLILRSYIDRLSALSKKPRIKYVSIFRNHGREAGASLSHAHTQIIATPLVPRMIVEELNASHAFLKKRGACAYCEVISHERKSPRHIYENDDFIAIAPWAGIYPFEFWIIPRRHSPSLLDIRPNELDSLAEAIRVGLGSLNAALGDPPYNYSFHIAPTRGKYDHYHWHLEIYPRLSELAGFELGTGMYINAHPPEMAARLLKGHIEGQIEKLTG